MCEDKLTPDSNLQSNNRDWPRMDPGDGKDNDEDGSIDEDDCCMLNCYIYILRYLPNSVRNQTVSFSYLQHMFAIYFLYIEIRTWILGKYNFSRFNIIASVCYWPWCMNLNPCPSYNRIFCYNGDINIARVVLINL